MFERHWVCLRSGLTFGEDCECSAERPHPSGCGYRWETSLTDDEMVALLRQHPIDVFKSILDSVRPVLGRLDK